MAPIEELLYQWSDYVKGKAGPTGYPSQSLMQSIYTFKLDEDAPETDKPLTAWGTPTRSLRSDWSPEWPEVAQQIEAGMSMLRARHEGAYFALVAYYLGKVPGARRQDSVGSNRGWRVVSRGVDEGREAYIWRLARAMPWKIGPAAFYNHMKIGHESLASFMAGVSYRRGECA